MPNAAMEAWSIPVVTTEHSCWNERMGVWPGRGGSMGTGPPWGGEPHGRLPAAGGWRLQHPAALRPRCRGVWPPQRSQVLNVGRCCLPVGCGKALLFWKGAAPSRDSGASKLSLEPLGSDFFFLLSLVRAGPVWGQSVAAWGAEVPDGQSCMPAAGNYRHVTQNHRITE